MVTEFAGELGEQILPFQSRFAVVAGYRMHYIDEGHGPVVLLLHGNPTWCYYYRNVVRALREKFRVIVPDHLGCGLSDRTPGVRLRADDRVRHLDEFIRNLGITKFSMVMHDWGGPIGTGFAVRNPEMITRLVYLNTTLTETESLPSIIKTAAKPIIGKFLTMYTARFVRVATTWGVSKRLMPDVKARYLYPYRTAARRQAIWDFVADIPFDNSHPSYSTMLEMAAKLPLLSKTPVKIIWGLKDPCFHKEMLSKVAAHFPHAEIVEVPEASHLILEDAPEVVIPNIVEFLERDLSGESRSKPSDNEQLVASNSSGDEHAIYAGFKRCAESNPNSDAVIVPKWLPTSLTSLNVHYVHTTFSELSRIVNQYQRGLTELGLAPGDRVLMLVPPGSEFLALSLAVMGRGATPLYLDPGIGIPKLTACIQNAAPHAFIGSPKAQILRVLKRSLFKRLKFHLTSSEWSPTGGPTTGWLKRFSTLALPPVVFPSGLGRTQNAALLAFTSGATGTPKGVVFTNEMLKAQLEIFRSQFEMQPGVRDMPLLPIFSIFNVALGVGSVFPPMNTSKPLALDPTKIVKIVKDLSVNTSFGSPTLWNKIGEYCVRSRTTLPTLKRIFMAGAPVPRSVVELMRNAAPNSEVYTPYGATEALPVTLLSGADLLSHKSKQSLSGEQGVFVGKPVAGVDLRIVAHIDGAIRDISESRSLPPYEIGEILVRGANISSEYLHRPDANRTGKIVDGETVWHRMGDLGYLDEVGNLYFCGRGVHSVYASHRIYHSVPIEEMFNALPKVRRAALVSLRQGQEAGIVIEPFPQYWPENDKAREEFTAELKDTAARSKLSADIEKFFFHQSFPVDARHNAKIFRDVLSEWADKELSPDKAA